MNIERIQVLGLFDDLNHDLMFKGDENIMILTGLNGSGKTTILNLIDVLFNQSPIHLLTTPFHKINLFFDDGTILLLDKATIYSNEDDRNNLHLSLSFKKHGVSHFFDLTKNLIDDENTKHLLSSIERMIPELRRIDHLRWQNAEGLILSIADILIEYSDHLKGTSIEDILQTIPSWFQDLKSSMNIRFINTERLTHVIPNRRRHNQLAESIPAVNHNSNHLAENIKNLTAQYGLLSQSLERTFPVRVAEEHQASGLSVSSLRDELEALENKRSDLESAGLIPKEDPQIEIPDFADFHESQIDILSAIPTNDLEFSRSSISGTFSANLTDFPCFIGAIPATSGHFQILFSVFSDAWTHLPHWVRKPFFPLLTSFCYSGEFKMNPAVYCP